MNEFKSFSAEKPPGQEFNTDTQEWEYVEDVPQVAEKALTPDEADAAIAEALNQKNNPDVQEDDEVEE